MTDITQLTQESARESGSILIIVAARMARREFFTPLHAICESGKRVVSTRALCDAVERAEEYMVSQVQKIVDGHDRLTKKLKEAESRNAELVEALEKAQQEHRLHAALLISEKALLKERIAELEEAEQKLCAANVTLDARAELAERQLAELESRTVKLQDDAEHDIMAPVAAYLSEKFKWDGGAARWDGRKEYDVLADKVKYALGMVIRRAAGVKWEDE